MTDKEDVQREKYNNKNMTANENKVAPATYASIIHSTSEAGEPLISRSTLSLFESSPLMSTISTRCETRINSTANRQRTHGRILFKACH